MVDLTLLDQSVAKLAEDAAELPLEDLLALLGAEQIGKTRKGAIDLLEGLIAAFEPPVDDGDEAEDEGEAEDPALAPIIEAPSPNTITNCIPGTMLHLGDGRKLAHGESAEVGAELAEALRTSGQAE